MTVTPTNTGKKFNRKASTPITPTPFACAGPSASGGSLTLKPGEQRSVQFSLAPSGCPLGPGGAILQVDATARSAGTALATARAYYQITLETL